MEGLTHRKRRNRWYRDDRDFRPCGHASGRTGPRHRRVVKIVIYTFRGRTGFARAAHTCAAPARSDVRSAPERSALPEIGGRTYLKISLSNHARAYAPRKRDRLDPPS